jgi:hypothetical protein
VMMRMPLEDLSQTFLFVHGWSSVKSAGRQ